MMVCALKVATLADLRAYVRRTLCDMNHLAEEAYAVRESRWIRRGELCGLMFSVRGPRLDIYTAVWEAARNAVFFYDSRGERMQITQLVDCPELPVA